MDVYVFPGIITIAKSDFVRLERSWAGSGGYLYYKKLVTGLFYNSVQEEWMSLNTEQYKLCERVLQQTK